jgi:hypothetical protein
MTQRINNNHIKLEEITQHFLQFHIHVKIYHWQTTSYSRHKSSDKLFNSLLEKIDEFIEISMGHLSSHLKFKKNQSISLINISDSKIQKILKQFEKYLIQLDSIKYTDLLNIRDEILGLLYQTHFLFSLK